MNADHNGKGSRQRLPWTIAAIAVVALVANLVWGQKGREAAADEAIATLNQRLDALEEAPRDARRPPASRPGATRPVEGGAASMGGAMEEPRTPEQLAAERERQLRELEAQFARDVADPVGGPETENRLVDTISGESMASTGLRPSNVDIACKKASCRIVGSFDRMGDAQDWGLFYITAAGGDVLSSTRMVFVPKPDGGTEVRIYSNRAGS